MNAIIRFSICSLIIAILGCRPPGFEIGGGACKHLPPRRIIQGTPTPIEIELAVWGEGTGKLSQRYTHLTCHYWIVGEQGQMLIPMEPKREDGKKILFTCDIPPQERAGATLEYYIDMQFDGRYFRHDGAKVAIIEHAEEVDKQQP